MTLRLDSLTYGHSLKIERLGNIKILSLAQFKFLLSSSSGVTQAKKTVMGEEDEVNLSFFIIFFPTC